MRGIYRFLKSTLLGGLVVLVPVAVILAVVGWVVQSALAVLMPVFEWLPDKSVGGVSLTALGILGVVVIGCFFAGLLAETAIIRRVSDHAEQFAQFVPGYALMKNVGTNLVGIESKHPVRTVL